MIYHHLPIFSLLEYKNVKHKSDKCSYKFFRQTRDSNINNFANKLAKCNWNDVYVNDDVNLAYKSFHKKYVDLYNETCPLVKMKCTDKCQKPWLTKGLISAIKKKNYLYKSLIKYNSKEAEKKYKTYKNKLTSIWRIAEKDYYNTKLQEYKNDMKNTWKILNDITQRKNNNNIVCSEFQNCRQS